MRDAFWSHIRFLKVLGSGAPTHQPAAHELAAWGGLKRGTSKGSRALRSLRQGKKPDSAPPEQKPWETKYYL